MDNGYDPRVNQRSPYLTQIIDKTDEIARYAGAGVLGGYVFSIIDPIGGAVFGATSTLIDKAGEKITELAAPGSRSACKFFIHKALLITNITVSAFATNALGFPVTVFGGAKLMLAMWVSKFAIDRIVDGVKREGLFASADHIARYAAAGAVGGYALGVINPIGGAIFAGTAALSRIAAGESAGARLNALKSLFFYPSIPVGVIAATAFGFPVTVLGATGLTLAMLVSKCAIDLGIQNAKLTGTSVKHVGPYVTANQIARGALAGALAGYVFSIINPVGGAIFGANFALFGITDRVPRPDASLFKRAFASSGVAFALSIPVGAVATAAFGFPVTILGGYGLAIATLVSRIAVEAGIQGAKRVGGYVFPRALAAKQNAC
jgi:hypothetical protein